MQPTTYSTETSGTFNDQWKKNTPTSSKQKQLTSPVSYMLKVQFHTFLTLPTEEGKQQCEIGSGVFLPTTFVITVNFTKMLSQQWIVYFLYLLLVQELSQHSEFLYAQNC